MASGPDDLAGSDLVAALRTVLSWPLPQRLLAIDAIAEDLALAHARGIVHGVLGRRSIFIVAGGRPAVDFSPAEPFAGPSPMGGDFRSPEQLMGKTGDARSDVFAAGCLFYEILTGEPPFRAGQLSALIYGVMYEDPAPVSESAPAVPRAVSDVVARAMAKDPSARFPSAVELRDALRAAAHRLA